MARRRKPASGEEVLPQPRRFWMAGHHKRLAQPNPLGKFQFVNGKMVLLFLHQQRCLVDAIPQSRFAMSNFGSYSQIDRVIARRVLADHESALSQFANTRSVGLCRLHLPTNMLLSPRAGHPVLITSIQLLQLSQGK